MVLFKLVSLSYRQVLEEIHFGLCEVIKCSESISELGANLAGQDRLDNAEEEEMSTSGVSTVNSTKLKPINSDTKYLNEEFSKLKVQNVHLMQNLLESHKLYQALLKSTIEEQRLNLDLLRNFSTQLTNATVLYERSISQGYNQLL